MLCRSKLSRWVLENFQKVYSSWTAFCFELFHSSFNSTSKRFKTLSFIEDSCSIYSSFFILWLNAVAQKSKV